MAKVILGIWPNLSVEVEGNDSFEILKELAFWDSVPHKCPVRLNQEEICGQELHFTFRSPTAKTGPNKGKTFPYAGLECTGDPSHECQFSRREDGSGIFIRQGNRNDGKPNWRLAYKLHGDDDAEDEPYRAPGADRQPPATAGDSEVDQRVTELLKLGREKGYINEAALNIHCRSLYRKDVQTLCGDKEAATEYYRTLRSM